MHCFLVCHGSNHGSTLKKVFFDEWHAWHRTLQGFNWRAEGSKHCPMVQGWLVLKSMEGPSKTVDPRPQSWLLAP